MSDTNDKALDVILDRFKNPFLLAFAISWAVFNWKGIAFFFLSGLPVEDRFERIDEAYINIWRGLVFPLISSFVYAGFLNHIMVPFDGWSNAGALKRGKSKHKREIAELEEIKEKAQLEYEIIDIRAGSKSIKEWENKIKEKDKQLTISESVSANRQTQLSQCQIELGNVQSQIQDIKVEKDNLILNARFFGISIPLSEEFIKVVKYFNDSALNMVTIDQYRLFCFSLFDHKVLKENIPRNIMKFQEMGCFDIDSEGFCKLTSTGFMLLVYVLKVEHANEIND